MTTTCLAVLCAVLPALDEPQTRATRPSDALPEFRRTEDVIYGRKFGTALTMDVFAPTTARNGAAVIWVVSGGWVSDHDRIAPRSYAEFLRRGYTVFAVVHGSQPKYTIPEILDDMHRAVRFIRFHAERFAIDPDRIGISGGSAGGHLALMMGLEQQPPRPKKKDPVDRELSRVAAVACFFPPTDFMNYGRPGRNALQAIQEELRRFQAPFDFHQPDPDTGRFVPLADEHRRLQVLRRISPVTHVSADDPPVLMVHGDADALVPIQQAQTLAEALRSAGVPVKLVVRPGAKHGWPGLHDDVALFADWFDTHMPPTRP